MEELDPSPEYIEAFNQGYYLKKFDPELFARATKVENAKSERLKAMNDGAKQFDLEQFKSQIKNDQINERSR